jgi:hypothetical protein
MLVQDQADTARPTSSTGRLLIHPLWPAGGQTDSLAHHGAQYLVAMLELLMLEW